MTTQTDVVPVPLRSGSEPQLQFVDNLTSFRHFQCQKMAPGRRYCDVVVVKGTFDLGPGSARPSPDQQAFAFADSYHDANEPTRSSVEQPGDLVVTKPGSDVFLTGAAQTSDGRRRERWTTSVAVHAGRDLRASHSLEVTGPRSWVHTRLRGWGLSQPEPTDEVPLRYELAYGGAYPDPRHRPGPHEAHRWIQYPENPCGSGYWDPDVLDRGRAYPGPQWFTPGHSEPKLLSKLPLAGFGPIARWWNTRLRYAGTYDARAVENARREAANGIPADYAADFDDRFFQCAHPSLVLSDYLRGDETITLTGLCRGAEGRMLQLPQQRLRAYLLRADKSTRFAPLPLDTVHIDLAKEQFTLTWRLTILQMEKVRVAAIQSLDV